MSPKAKFDEESGHKHFAQTLFNYVWTLIEKEKRSAEEEDAMIHGAHASCYHWSKIGKPVNLARGEWQISRVYSVAGRAEPALAHARRCLEICQQHDIGDFDLAFAYEALARASAVAGSPEDRARYFTLAEQAGQAIKHDEDRQVLTNDLKTIPSSE